MHKPQNIIFYDGTCKLCNGAVQWVLKRDSKNKFHFAQLQGETAKMVLPQALISSDKDLTTLVVLVDGEIYTQSTAALKIAWHMPWPSKGLYLFNLIPRVLRDPVYRFISRNRYKWFGKYESCLMPTENLRKRFLP
jgi:predicted DCC family thiol-disulfide oxidoreductase YuxK